MTIDAAVETLVAILSTDIHAGHTHHEAAIQLGIEALKEIKKSRLDPSSYMPRLLPGETKE